MQSEAWSKILTPYPVRDWTTRWFHWINVICNIALGGIGTVLLNEELLGLSTSGKPLWSPFFERHFGLVS
jgi:hypothetical protein